MSAALDLVLGVGPVSAFARLRVRAGPDLQLTGDPSSFEVTGTPVTVDTSPDYDQVRCVLRGRLVEDARGCRARGRLRFEPYWPAIRGTALVTAWASGLNLLADLAVGHERWSRLRRQRRLMQRMWTEAFTPVALAATDDPFRGLAMLPSRT